MKPAIVAAMFMRRTIEAQTAKLSTPKRHPAKRGPRYLCAARPSRPNIDCFFIWMYGNLCKLLEGSSSCSPKVASSICISELPSDCHRGCIAGLFVVSDKDGTGSNIAFNIATRIARFRLRRRKLEGTNCTTRKTSYLTIITPLWGASFADR